MNDLWLSIGELGQPLGLSSATTHRIVLTGLVLIVYIAMRVVLIGVVPRRFSDPSRQYAFSKSVNYGLGFSLLLAIVLIWLGNFSGLVAYLGILSAGLAIALQDPLTNLAGWIFIAFRKPFVVGDRIEIAGHAGDVIDLRIFQFTLVEIGNWVDADQSTGRIIHLPNGWVFKHSVANYAQGFNFIWAEIPIVVTFESKWEEAKKILSDIAREHSIIRTQKAEQQIRQAARRYMIYFQHLTPIVWTSVADNGVTLTLRYICEPRKRRSTENAIWEDVLRAFAERPDIDFAYPTTRFYDNVSEGKPKARAPQPRTGFTGP